MAYYVIPDIISEAQVIILQVKNKTTFRMHAFGGEMLLGITIDESFHIRKVRIIIVNKGCGIFPSIHDSFFSHFRFHGCFTGLGYV